MGKRVKSRPGDFVALPLPSGGYAYGRILNKLMAFYNLKSEELMEVDQISGMPILFITAVHRSAISWDRWSVIGNRPLELELIEDTRFFRKNPSGQGFLIYVSKPNPPSAYEEYEASVEECRGLEPLVSWEPAHIEQRIDDHFRNMDNPQLTRFLEQLVEKDRGTQH